MIRTIIVASAQNGVIGKGGELPWHLPADLKHFQQTTTGHSVIMGRKSFDSLGKPLKNRRNIVVTRQNDLEIEGAEVVGSIEEALARCAGEKEVFILGGGEIFRQAFEKKLVDKIVQTLIHDEFEGDTSFEIPDESDWQVLEQEHHMPDEKNAHPFTIRVLMRN